MTNTANPKTSAMAKTPMPDNITKQLEGGNYFKEHERRYGFNGGKRPKHTEWEGKAEGEIEVEYDQHFNTNSKYWFNYYNKN